MNSLRDFFETVDSTEPLPKSIVHSLCRRAQSGDTAARDQLWRSHLRLIAYVAKRFYRSDGFLDWGDLMQQGSLGLLQSIEHFDPTKRSHRRPDSSPSASSTGSPYTRRVSGRRIAFPWYAMFWISHRIRRELQKRGRTIYLPVYLQQELARWKQELKGMRFRQQKRTSTQIQRLMCVDQTLLSLDFAAPQGQETPRRSCIPWLGGWDPCEQELIQWELGQAVRQLVRDLPPREGYVVQKQFGLGSGMRVQESMDYEMSSDALASEMGVTPERIRQLRQKGLYRLRQAVRLRPELHPDGYKKQPANSA